MDERVAKAVSTFKRVYPEKEVSVFSARAMGEKNILGARFPDGDFWFIVGFGSVSASYNSMQDAEREVLR